jgi:DHA2 family multidrug resistance protein-like MFS transporter
VPRSGPREPFDLAGAVLLTLATGSLLLAMNRIGRGEWLGLPLAALFAAALIGFLRQSRRTPRPVIALRYFALPGFAWLNAANALVNFAGFAVLLFVPFYLTGVARLPTALAGLLLAVSPAGAMLAALPGGWLLERVAAPRLAAAGMALTGLGLGCMALWDAKTPLPLLALALLLHGAGLGLLQLGTTDSMTATLPRADRGVAGSLAMMTRTLGVVSAASLLTLAFAALEAGGGFLGAFQASFAGVAAIPALVLLAGLVPRRRRPA